MDKRPVRASALRHQYIQHRNQRVSEEARCKVKGDGRGSRGGGGSSHQDASLEDPDFEQGERWAEIPDLNQMETASLQKYRRVFKLSISNNASREELLRAVKAHFVNWENVDDEETLINFLVTYSKQSQQHQQGNQARSARPSRLR
ncbi:hypothetical protein BSKO_07955 [Bryopsis sp. KO-2023]|nr:hypothetical protein BSKO_07955 [Bryopsis sp. KO-2023]